MKRANISTNFFAYCISDKVNVDFQNLEASLEKIASRANMIVFRDKNSPNYQSNAKLFLQNAKKFPFEKILLHTDITLAYSLQADGIHLSSNQFNEIQKAKELGLFVVISAHDTNEVQKAQTLGADMVTLSPIFHSPNKGEPLGIEKLKEVIKQVRIPIIALGGIVTEQQIQECSKAGTAGFASIRYFT